MPDLEPLPDLDTAPLFTPLRVALTTLLRGLQPADWNASTVAGAWRVRDIVAHLLDGELRTLAAHRDGHPLAADGTVQGYTDVIALVQGLNAEGVAAGRHWSPRILIDLLETSGAWMAAFIATLDPDAPALSRWRGGRSGLDESIRHGARVYRGGTTRCRSGWRSAIAASTGSAPRRALRGAVVETAARVPPDAYRGRRGRWDHHRDRVISRGGRRCAVAGRSWMLRQERGAWHLYAGTAVDPTLRVTAGPDLWWRLFFNAIAPDDVAGAFDVEGDTALAEPLWGARSVMV